MMRIDEYPQFNKITPENTLTGTIKLALNYEVKLGQHLDNLKGLHNLDLVYDYIIIHINLRFIAPMHCPKRFASHPSLIFPNFNGQHDFYQLTVKPNCALLWSRGQC